MRMSAPSTPPRRLLAFVRCEGRRHRARFQPRLAIRRRRVDHRAVDRGGLGRSAAADGIENVLALVVRLAGRAGRGRVGADGRERGRARFQRRLLAHDLIELLLELLLVEQLAAGDAVDLRAQFGDAVFIGELHFGLACNEPLEHVVVEREIGAGHDRPAGHDHEAADHDPEGDRAEPDLAAGMGQRVVGRARGGAARLRMMVVLLRVVLLRVGRLVLGMGGAGMLVGPAFGNASGIAAMIVGTLAVGHQRSPPVPHDCSKGGPTLLMRRFEPGMVNFPQMIACYGLNSPRRRHRQAVASKALSPLRAPPAHDLRL